MKNIEKQVLYVFHLIHKGQIKKHCTFGVSWFEDYPAKVDTFVCAPKFENRTSIHVAELDRNSTRVSFTISDADSSDYGTYKFYLMCFVVYIYGK